MVLATKQFKFFSTSFLSWLLLHLQHNTANRSCTWLTTRFMRLSRAYPPWSTTEWCWRLVKETKHKKRLKKKFVFFGIEDSVNGSSGSSMSRRQRHNFMGRLSLMNIREMAVLVMAYWRQMDIFTIRTRLAVCFYDWANGLPRTQSRSQAFNSTAATTV